MKELSMRRLAMVTALLAVIALLVPLIPTPTTARADTGVNGIMQMVIQGTTSTGVTSSSATSSANVTLTFSIVGSPAPSLMRITNDYTPENDCTDLGTSSWPS